MELTKVEGKPNPITGQHVELPVQPAADKNIDKTKFKEFLTSQLPNHMLPKRLKVTWASVDYRFKRA